MICWASVDVDAKFATTRSPWRRAVGGNGFVQRVLEAGGGKDVNLDGAGLGRHERQRRESQDGDSGCSKQAELLMIRRER
ncbi:MAG: hypothetical protein M5R36_00145 [Deltaproteobacteria bacterium]|nr:hypothetical protein [Deltaproteobacteria bacterium]